MCAECSVAAQKKARQLRRALKVPWMLRVVATQSPSIVCPSPNAVNRQHCRKFDLLGATHIGFDVDQMRRFAKALSCDVGRSSALALYPATSQEPLGLRRSKSAKDRSQYANDQTSI
jgi:hypothetical protein